MTRPTESVRADILQDFAEVEKRIGLLLRRWGLVNPDMLREYPPELRDWVIEEYYKRHLKRDPVVMRGHTLLLPVDAQRTEQRDAEVRPKDASPKKPARCRVHKQKRARWTCGVCSARMCKRCSHALANGTLICPRCLAKTPRSAISPVQMLWVLPLSPLLLLGYLAINPRAPLAFPLFVRRLCAKRRFEARLRL